MPAPLDSAGPNQIAVAGEARAVPGADRIYAGAGCEAGAGDRELKISYWNLLSDALKYSQRFIFFVLISSKLFIRHI